MPKIKKKSEKLKNKDNKILMCKLRTDKEYKKNEQKKYNKKKFKKET